MSGPRDRYDTAPTSGDAFAATKRRRAVQLEIQQASWWSVWKQLEPFVVGKEQRLPTRGTFLRIAFELYADYAVVGGTRCDGRPIPWRPS